MTPDSTAERSPRPHDAGQKQQGDRTRTWSRRTDREAPRYGCSEGIEGDHPHGGRSRGGRPDSTGTVNCVRGQASIQPIKKLSLPDKPSIVVLPFTNLSGEAINDYFADGMVEDITVALGRCSWLFVIASRSAFAYKGRAVDLRHIGAELGVRYALTGSVRKDDQRVRIVVQLSDASDGVQIWADRFEGRLDAIFDIQDQVATHVAGMVAPALRSVEMQRAQRKPTDNLTAYDLFLRALQHIHRGEESNREALRLLYAAIEHDASYGAAYGLAAWCYRLRKVHGWMAPSDPKLGEGIRLAHLASATNRRDSEGLWMAANALAHLSGELDLGLSMIEKSLSLNPNSAGAWWAGGMLHAFCGNDTSAMTHLDRAYRFNPLDTQPHVHWSAVAYAHFMAGRYDDAEQVTDRMMSKPAPTAPWLESRSRPAGCSGDATRAGDGSSGCWRSNLRRQFPG